LDVLPFGGALLTTLQGLRTSPTSNTPKTREAVTPSPQGGEGYSRGLTVSRAADPRPSKFRVA
jgi:hypothetical protein